MDHHHFFDLMATSVLVNVLVHPINSSHGLIVVVYQSRLINVDVLPGLPGEPSCFLCRMDTHLVGDHVDNIVVIPTDYSHSVVCVSEVVVGAPLEFSPSLALTAVGNLQSDWLE